MATKTATLFGAPDNPMAMRNQGSYANPHATIALQDIPIQLKQLFRLTRYYYCTDSLMRAILQKMAEYPITEVIIEDPQSVNTPATKEKWGRLLNTSLNIRMVMKSIKIDKYIFGNSFHYLYLPFVRYARCTACSEETPLRALKRIQVKTRREKGRFTFNVTSVCPKCSKHNQQREFTIEDRRSEASPDLKFIRLNPLRMKLEYNPASGARQWYWTPPADLRSQFLDNVRVITDTTEMTVLEAVMDAKELKMNSDRLWVAQSEQVPGVWEGWGFPPIFPALEDVYYYKILRRANEALAQEHVTPLRILTPAATGDISPQRAMNLSDWQVQLKKELQKFKRDPNHIAVSPVPVNVEQMGGNARVMMVAQEMEAAARVIAAAVGCPIEMVWGGLNYSGGSVSLRVLENHFINEREDDQRLLDFIMPRLARHYRLPKATAKMSDFKMADDAAQTANSVNLLLQGFLSRKSVLPELGHDPDTEFDHLMEEHKKLNAITMQDNLASAHMQTIVQALEAKANIMLQFELKLQTEIMQASAERKRLSDLNAHVQSLHEKGYTSPIELDQSAQILASMQPEMQQAVLSTWGTTMPLVTRMLMMRAQQNQAGMAAVQTAMAAPGAAQSAGAAEGPSMDPGAQGPYSEGGDAGGQDLAPDVAAPPEVLPPRRQ
jgi:hypothetical protein